MFRYIRVMSDLHLEFDTFDVPVLDTDNETVLVLAGDIHVKDGAEKSGWMANLAQRFFHVIRILGNHEHYRSSLDVTPDKIKTRLFEQSLTNVTLLDNQFIELESTKGCVRFVGGTMWTDLNKGCPHTVFTVQCGMNDYKYIRINKYAHKLRPCDVLNEHAKSKAAFEAALDGYTGIAVAISHHAPHQMSVGPAFQDQYLMNGGYRSDLSEFILDRPSLKFWFHGHIHNASDYMIGDTRVVCNPRGYAPNYLAHDFNPVLRFDLEELQ
jgi:hypothetical protein